MFAKVYAPTLRVGIRAFSTKTAATKSAAETSASVPDMDMYHDYNLEIATNLFNDLQSTKGNLKAVPSVFEKFAKVTRTVPHAIDILEHPLVTDARRLQFIQEIVQHFGGDKPVADAILRINNDSKFDEVPEILKEFNKLSSDVLKETVATITTAEPLSKDALKIIEKGLLSHVKKGYKLTLVEKVDPKLIAGFIVDMDDMNQDLSLSSYVANLDKIIDNAVQSL